MARLLEDIACGLLGYGIGRNQLSDETVKMVIDAYLENVTPENLVRDYAKFHPEYLNGTLNEQEEPYGYGGSYF